MAFKMKGFNPGVGTGMNSSLKKSSSFKRDDKYVASNPDAKNPDPNAGKVESTVSESTISFGEAFNRAVKQGKKTFTWEGKSYTTELASNKKQPEKEIRGKKETVDAVKDTVEKDKNQPKKEVDKQPEVEKNKLIETLRNLAKHHPAIKAVDLHNKTVDWLRNKINQIKK
tara:strand:- start:342 stop:851 length:510 start_codon:yes stop_codon:yes gene_type:complete